VTELTTEERRHSAWDSERAQVLNTTLHTITTVLTTTLHHCSQHLKPWLHVKIKLFY